MPEATVCNWFNVLFSEVKFNGQVVRSTVTLQLFTSDTIIVDDHSERLIISHNLTSQFLDFDRHAICRTYSIYNVQGNV